jgi:hypothetical protein
MRYASAQNFLNVPLRNVRLEVSATAPADPQVGQVWTDSSVTPAKVKWWDGVKWVASDGTSIPTGFITDALINAAANIQLSKLAVDPLARANHTGTQPSSTISDFDTQVRTSRLDQMAAPTQNVDVNGVRFTNLSAPVAPGDAANKAYVDNARAGISVKDPVRVVVQGNVNISTPGASLDGVSMNVDDRVLLVSQNNGTQNGIWVWNGPSTAMTMPPDADGAGDVPDGALVAVAEGTSANYQYMQEGSSGGTPGSWTQQWLVFAIGGQTYTPGNGLVINGTEFSLDAPVSVANGGTGASTAVDARANLGALTKYAGDMGALTAGVTYTINHGLNTADVGVWFKTTDDSRVIDMDWATTGANTIAVYPDVSMNAGSVRALLVG